MVAAAAAARVLSRPLPASGVEMVAAVVRKDVALVDDTPDVTSDRDVLPVEALEARAAHTNQQTSMIKQD